MGKIYHRLVKKHNKKIPFVILVYFLATFIIIRALVYAWTYGLIPEFSLVIRGIEVHHFNFGIFLLAFVGYFLLVDQKNNSRLKMAKIYGIGLALAFDEFGMWLHLKNNYWLRQSYDGVIIIAIILLNAIYLSDVWKDIIEDNIRLARKIWEKGLKRVYLYLKIKKDGSHRRFN